MSYEYKKALQLGMPSGTAANRLRKSILFSLLKKLGENFCYQCGAEIENENELSIEHKTAWLNSENPKELFFDLDNIAFSHLSCNCGAAKGWREAQHPSWYSYKKGCRCKECTDINTERVQFYRDKRNIGS